MATRLLLIVRHAKSSWDDPGLHDHERGLAPRGLKALPRIRDHVESSGHEPTLVLCSSARRARDTLEGIRSALPATTEIVIEPDLYTAEADDLLQRLRTIDDTTNCVALIGHNPALQDLALRLAVNGDNERSRQLAEKLPTGAVATISFDCSWADIGPATGQLQELFQPRRR